MVLPPQPSTNPPTLTPGDIHKGARLDTIDLEAVVNGGMPPEFITAAAVDTAALAAVPSNRFRCIQHAWAWSDNLEATITFRIARAGNVFDLGLSDVYPQSADAVPATSNGQNNRYFRALILKPGDVLSAVDTAAGGSTITITLAYVDVLI